MTGLVLTSSLFFLFIFWEMTALCSYALISFYNDDPKEVAGGIKALIITQVGGVGLLTGAVRRFQPEHILLFDVADFGGKPGEVTLLDWQETSGFSASTHSLPLGVLSAYLNSELNCPVQLVGIQPPGLDFDTPLSNPVKKSVQEIVTAIQNIFNERSRLYK